MYLFHGVYGSCWCWSQKAGAHYTAQRLIDQAKIHPMVIAMPSDGLWGDGSAYLSHHGQNFEKWIVEDVPAAIRQNIPQCSETSSLFIAGLSMGGFGALRIVAKYPGIFSGISGHSSITSLDQMCLFDNERLSNYQQANQVDEDVFSTVQVNKDKPPPLRFDCGKTDELIEYNRKLHQQMEDAGIPHIYEEFEGGHQWSYWEKHLVDTLIFFDNLLK